MSLIELPLGLPGRIFRSPMPFGPYDLHGEVYDRWREEQIAVIVLLASDEECLHKTGRNLREFYRQEGFEVPYLPIPDFGIPTKDDLAQAVQRTIAYARAGQHIVIHCSAGIGRTGLFMAYVAKRVLGISGEEALQWVRHYIPRAVETSEQQWVVRQDERIGDSNGIFALPRRPHPPQRPRRRLRRVPSACGAPSAPRPPASAARSMAARACGGCWTGAAACGREPAYKGLTISWRYDKVGRLKPEAEWLSLPEGVTPALVDRDLWEATQKQRVSNTGAETRNQARPYL
jgi:protein-tyrosine phosphatase